METNFLTKMVLSFVAWTIVLVITSMRLSETAELSQMEEQNACRNLGLSAATITLHVTDVVILILATFDSIFYTVQYVMYRKSRRPQPDDPESVALAKIS